MDDAEVVPHLSFAEAAELLKLVAAGSIRPVIGRRIRMEDVSFDYGAERYLKTGVAIKPERFAIATMRGPVVPGTHERVLKNRQLIGVVAHVVFVAEGDANSVEDRHSCLSFPPRGQA